MLENEFKVQNFVEQFLILFTSWKFKHVTSIAVEHFLFNYSLGRFVLAASESFECCLNYNH